MKHSDVNEVAKIWSNAFPKQFASSISESKELIKKVLKENNNLCFVAIEKKNIIGFVMGHEFSGDIVSLGPIAVDQIYRGKGIGKALVKRFEKASKNMKYSAILFPTRYIGETIEERKYEASLFYESLGFKEIARSKEKGIYFKRI